jgi:hypothetical protein
MMSSLSADELIRLARALARARELPATGGLAPALEDLLLVAKLDPSLMSVHEPTARSSDPGAVAQERDRLVALSGEPLSATVLSDRR